MKLEEYVYQCKKEDGINEYDLEKRTENTRICVNYIFEYFNNYLATTQADQHTILHDIKIDKYRKVISNYDPEVVEWLVSIYSSYGKYLQKHLGNMITDDYFLFYNSEPEFRALSYEVYPKAVKKFSFLEGQSEMVYKFIKSYHKVQNIMYPYEQEMFISEEINKWVNDTYKKYGVNILRFCMNWVDYFYDNTEIWPKGHKRKSEEYDKYKDSSIFRPSDSLYWDYDYRQKNNLFGLDKLYRNMPKKDFTKGRKQDFEAVLMYFWLHQIVGDKDGYWEEYSQTVL